ncbi:Uma2 family endonuclease [Nocardia halotolerans]|uniref:Uma2 family endonuclease n=1 Tax=Nocardia halotolerans TaxID=1755878 RepID=A0ABV8VMT3_9NOCA
MTTAARYEPPEDRSAARSPSEVLLDGFHAFETPDGFRAELIEGEIVVTPPPDGSHESAIASLVRQVMKRSKLETDASGNKGLSIGGGPDKVDDHVIPDAVFVPVGAFAGQGSWMPPDHVLMVAEVTSYKADRDRGAKRRAYARGNVPLYLLIDQGEQSATLFGEPGGSGDLIDYRASTRVPFGKSIELPSPFAFTLETNEFG